MGAHLSQMGLPVYPDAQVSHLAPTNLFDLHVHSPELSQLKFTEPFGLHEQSSCKEMLIKLKKFDWWNTWNDVEDFVNELDTFFRL